MSNLKVTSLLWNISHVVHSFLDYNMNILLCNHQLVSLQMQNFPWSIIPTRQIVKNSLSCSRLFSNYWLSVCIMQMAAQYKVVVLFLVFEWSKCGVQVLSFFLSFASENDLVRFCFFLTNRIIIVFSILYNRAGIWGSCWIRTKKHSLPLGDYVI